jgi:hypothetical protein
MELSEKVTSLNNDDLILLLTVLKAKPGTETEIYFAKRKRQIPVIGSGHQKPDEEVV